MILRNSLQAFPEKMQNQEKIADYENGIDPQLNQECAQRSGRLLFHQSRFFAFNRVYGRAEFEESSNSVAPGCLCPCRFLPL